MDNKMTTLGIVSGIVSAFIFVGSYLSPLFLLVALLYAFLKEKDQLVKDSAKKALYIYLVYEAVNLILTLVDKFVDMINKSNTEGYLKTMNVLDNVVGIAYLLVVIIFAVIALVQGLPQAAPAPMQYQAPQGAQQPRTCPTCKTLLAGPGICPNCGTNVQ